MREKSRNEDVLAAFTQYCETHPDEGFWQCLRGWTSFTFIYGSMSKPAEMIDWDDRSLE